ncbi:hypothetical protein [Marinomonas transparens]|uniref:Uncharacterized protein n=1 Tax=Marinomonas transparens TaxID=2795388 RepID=A0A934JU16_9GAMM|nr:hypothetical protein [Marinomonas transparens]MBJ7538292.1 hypothetical protein [Marinomonas transparens]
MNDNLILFPKIKRLDKECFIESTASDELSALRAEFDRARKDWPIELAELPENNKRFCYAKK